MRKFSKAAAGTAVTGAAFAAVLGLAAAPAFALTSVVTGSSSTGAITATASTPTLTDTTTGTKLTCTSSNATGTVKNGTNTPLGTINTVTFATCKGPAGITFTVTAAGTPWTLNATGVTSGGVTPGSLTGVRATLSGLCNATFAGTASSTSGATLTGSYKNSTHTLTINAGSLKAYSVSGLCLGLINNGDLATFNAAYVVSPALQLNVT
ncbi:hypothetical protein [Streptomyces sp. NBC_01190]|uniref:hypothetical protein n=1 Tax=Streptomyces sp. NBC_01190 TaxID=2903767 RepID=UPI003866BDA2|nr:hypothetical protein OG519_08605 [Streptomyces sp. NBC_01190]